MARHGYQYEFLRKSIPSVYTGIFFFERLLTLILNVKKSRNFSIKSVYQLSRQKKVTNMHYALQSFCIFKRENWKKKKNKAKQNKTKPWLRLV